MHYLSFTAFTGNYGAGQDRLGRAGFLHGSELIVDDDGRIEIFVGPERRGDNWLQTSPEPTLVAVRQFFLDRHNEVPISVRIECLDHDDLPPPLSAATFGRALESAAAFVAGCSGDRYLGLRGLLRILRADFPSIRRVSLLRIACCQSRNLKAARISATNGSGCSKAAKWPPTWGSFQYLMSV